MPIAGSALYRSKCGTEYILTSTSAMPVAGSTVGSSNCGTEYSSTCNRQHSREHSRQYRGGVGVVMGMHTVQAYGIDNTKGSEQ